MEKKTTENYYLIFKIVVGTIVNQQFLALPDVLLGLVKYSFGVLVGSNVDLLLLCVGLAPLTLAMMQGELLASMYSLFPPVRLTSNTYWVFRIR